MAIVATLQNPNLFSSLPSTPPPNDPSTASRPPPKPPIPIPKYPPPLKSRNYPRQPPKPTLTPAFKTFHRRTNYYKPVREGVVSTDGERAVVVGESGVSYLLPGAPFEFQFSYSETPKVKPVAIREPAFLPFAPPTMHRPWTGKAPLKSAKEKKKKIHLFDSLSPAPAGMEGAKVLEMRKAYDLGNFPAELKPRKSVIGPPLTKAEIRELVKPHISSNRQVNLGRDGLTHNMLELVHTHWKRRPVCKVRCLGVPTLDMDNVCRCLEEKTGGKIIHRVGGIAYIFRGRNYDPYSRPRYPVMLWKPATPVYPKLIQEAPEGLTKAEADKLRKKGKDLLPICKLAKNGVYTSLVKDVRNAFEGSLLVKINCKGLHPSDYKKIGAKLKELVPCVLLSFDDEQILMWRGQGWKSMYPQRPSASTFADSADGSNYSDSGNYLGGSRQSEPKPVTSSPKMMSLWNRAIATNKAMLLEETGLGPEELLKVVEEFEGLSQVAEHSYPALIVSREDDDNEDNGGYEDHNYDVDHEDSGEYENDSYDDDSDDDDEEYSSSLPLGSLPVDFIVNQQNDE